MRYQVRGLLVGDASQIVERVLEASDEPQAREQARAQGLKVLSLVQEPTPSRRASTPQPWRAIDLAWWCQELRTLLAAGMTAVEALETLQAQAQARSRQVGGVRVDIQTELLTRLHRGLALSQAMEQVQGFPSVLIASVRAAERTSSLTAALDDYLRYHEVLDRLRRRVISAGIYPLLVASVGLVVCTFLLIFVMPRFLGVLEGAHTAPTGVTALLISTSRWLNEHRGLAFGVIAAFVATFLWALRAGLLMKTALRLAMTVPAIARAVHAFDMAKLYQSVALLYRGGYVLEEALDVCRQSALAEGRPLAQRLESAQQALMRGQGIAAALSAAELTDEVSRRLLAVGERSGGIDTVLQVIAERHAQAVADFVDRFMRVVEPLMLLLVATAVGGVVVLMYLPIFDIASGLQT